jgi:tripartite motif-containing protein 71
MPARFSNPPEIARRVAACLLAMSVVLAAAWSIASPAQASTGAFDRAWGMNVNGNGVFGICTDAASCLGGTIGGLGGEMYGPSDAATDSSGNVYVADTSNNRIQKFDTSGTWDRAWGKNVNGGGAFGICTVAGDCLRGTTGGLGGEMNFPSGVATDSSGNVYVADAFNNRIQKFDSDGHFVMAWGKNVYIFGATGAPFEICTTAAFCQAGNGTGGLGGEMNFPSGVATDSAGSVYVADTGNHRIQRFGSSGAWDRAWGRNVNGGNVFGVCTVAANCLAGTTGVGGGEMYNPEGLATDATDHIYVADNANFRIQKFDSLGNWDRAWGRNVNGGNVFGICTVAASCLAGNADPLGGALGGEMYAPHGVSTDSGGNVYVADTVNNRIQKFTSAGAWDRAWGRSVNGGDAFGICTVAANCLRGTTGGLGGEMNYPAGVASDSTGNLYVADFSNDRIQKFSNADLAPPPGSTPPSTSGSGDTGSQGQSQSTENPLCLALRKQLKKAKGKAAKKRIRVKLQKLGC